MLVPNKRLKGRSHMLWKLEAQFHPRHLHTAQPEMAQWAGAPASCANSLGSVPRLLGLLSLCVGGMKVSLSTDWCVPQTEPTVSQVCCFEMKFATWKTLRTTSLIMSACCDLGSSQG